MCVCCIVSVGYWLFKSVVYSWFWGVWKFDLVYYIGDRIGILGFYLFVWLYWSFWCSCLERFSVVYGKFIFGCIVGLGIWYVVWWVNVFV